MLTHTTIDRDNLQKAGKSILNDNQNSDIYFKKAHELTTEAQDKSCFP